jgi:putative peptide zinc metalloprotease protein
VTAAAASAPATAGPAIGPGPAAVPLPGLPATLPPLRQDLQLHPAAPPGDGSPAWVIQDPVGNVFYRIGWLEFELLSRWTLGSPAALLHDTAAHTPLQPTAQELAALYDFLLGHQLLDVHDPRYTQHLLARHRKAHGSRARWLLHHYLFFRVPLLRPAQALQALLPWLAWVYTRGAALTLLGLGALGVVLTARQWDSFSASFVETLSVDGLWGYLVALAFTKSLHELGHALTATRHGLRVSHMGVAFVVMWPMLYTDTGESWRLRRKQQRLAIASAGLAAELALAVLATLAWNLAPDGSAAKQSLLYLASTAWLISLTLNVSPFMRFDGYFILSDALAMPNLHERSFALARTALRNTLLGLGEPEPERFSPGRRRALIAFAWATWLYRLVVFVGIAVAVYLLFFKVLGIFLFAVEIMWFVARPVWNEAQHWRRQRHAIQPRRGLAVAAAGAGLLLAGLLPWSQTVDAPAWAQPTQLHTFHSPLPARVQALVPAGSTVAAGSTVLALDQPDIGYRAELSRSATHALQQRLQGLGGEDRGEERRAQLQQQQALRQAEWSAQKDEAARLMLKAPFAGVLTEVDPELAPGVWVTPRQPLAVLVDPSRWQAEAYVAQRDLERLAPGAAVRFYPQGAHTGPALRGQVLDIGHSRTTALPQTLLATTHGGPIAVLPDAQGLTPRDTLYRVRIQLDESPPTLHVLRGQVHVEGQARSPLLEWLKPAAVLALREFSF